MIILCVPSPISPPPSVDLDHCPNCDSVFSSLESEQRETSRLTKENKALVNGIFQLQTEVLLCNHCVHFIRDTYRLYSI